MTRKASNRFFRLQLMLAAFFCLNQTYHMVVNGVQEGVSITMVLAAQVFLVVNLTIALHARRLAKTRTTEQNVKTYIMWSILCGINSLIVCNALWRNPHLWNQRENVTIIVMFIGLSLVFAGASSKDLSITDPIVRGCSALVFKAIPQLFQAWKFFQLGSSSWSGWAMLGGNLTILLRLAQIAISYNEAEKSGESTRPAVGLAIGEIGNELSWLIATLAWLLY